MSNLTNDNIKPVKLYCPGCNKVYQTGVMVQRIYKDQDGPICPRCGVQTEWDVTGGFDEKPKASVYTSRKDRRLAKKLAKKGKK